MLFRSPSLPPSSSPSLSLLPSPPRAHAAKTRRSSATTHAIDQPRVASGASKQPPCVGVPIGAARRIMNLRGRFAACGRELPATDLRTGRERAGRPLADEPTNQLQPISRRFATYLTRYVPLSDHSFWALTEGGHNKQTTSKKASKKARTGSFGDHELCEHSIRPRSNPTPLTSRAFFPVVTASCYQGDCTGVRGQGGLYLLRAVRSRSPPLCRRRRWHLGPAPEGASASGEAPLAVTVAATGPQAAPEEKAGQEEATEKRHDAKEQEEGQPAAAEAPAAGAAPAGAAAAACPQGPSHGPSHRDGQGGP